MKVKKNKLLVAIIFLLIVLFILFVFYKPEIEYAYNLVVSNKVSSENISFFLKNNNAFENYFLSEQKNIDIKKYKLKVGLFPAEKRITAEAEIKLKLSSGDRIILNFYDNMKIDNLLLNGKRSSFERDEKHLFIDTKSVNGDSIRIKIYYSGTPENMGFGSFVFDEYNGTPVVYSLSEPIFASTWFPCNDIPGDKALAELYITNDSDFVSVSNGKLIGIEKNGNRKTYHWKTVYPISTYLIAMYSAKYEHFTDIFITPENDSMKLEYFIFPDHLEEAQKDFEINKGALKIFSELFGTYPFIKEKYGVAEFLWQLGAIEHQTITGIGSNFLSGRKFFDDVYIHELAHQWWGDAVTVKSWKDVWLSEGFATYSEALFYERESGRDALISTMMEKFGSFEGKKLYDPGKNLFDKVVYNKGAWVLHMLRYEVGDENFFEILRNYYNKFKYKNASTRDFQNICETVSGKRLDDFFQQWIYEGKGIPVIRYEFSADSVSENIFPVTIKLKQIQDGYDVYKLPIVLRVRGISGEKTDTSFIFSDKVKILNMDVKFKPMDIIFDPENQLLAKFEKAMD